MKTNEIIWAFDLGNPSFNMSDWSGEHTRQDVRWKRRMPPVNNANYAWIQYFLHHLSSVGVAGFVMANGSMSSNQSSERPAQSTFSMSEAKVHGLERPRDFRHAIKKCRQEGIDCFNCR
jgi:type I restriction-modification system DNA methylase subunit